MEYDPVVWALKDAKCWRGRDLLTAIDRDGTQEGFDIDLIKKITSSLTIPVIASGGAGIITDFGNAIRGRWCFGLCRRQYGSLFWTK